MPLLRWHSEKEVRFRRYRIQGQRLLQERCTRLFRILQHFRFARLIELPVEFRIFEFGLIEQFVLNVDQNFEFDRVKFVDIKQFLKQGRSVLSDITRRT
jgi:hypothetical protein